MAEPREAKVVKIRTIGKGVLGITLPVQIVSELRLTDGMYASISCDAENRVFVVRPLTEEDLHVPEAQLPNLSPDNQEPG